ncbi:MAG: hypothetical protein HKN91_11000 [Acidimicrobiia bacterium]|nr:hypothetical protein [Acidimicrobiia bacterium]
MAEEMIFPRSGTWKIRGSNREYNWIGPRSTLPGAGNVFALFDRFLPFTKFITWIRRMFGNDDMDGTMTVKLSDCSRILEARGMVLERQGNDFVGKRNIEGTIHEMRLATISDTEMVETWKFSIEDATATMTPEQLADVQLAGVDIADLKGILLERDAHMVWTFQGDVTAEYDWLPDCIEAVRRSIVSQSAYRDAYADPDLLALAIGQGWDYDNFTEAVYHRGQLVLAAEYGEMDELSQHISDVASALAKTHGTEGVYEAAGSTDSSGTVAIPPGYDPIKQASVEAHEAVHVDQVEAFRQNWEPGGDYATVEDAIEAKFKDARTAAEWEPDAYQAGIDIYQEFLDAATLDELP